MKDKKKIELLKNELNMLHDASSVLNYSFKICNEIGIKQEYSDNELVEFEALTSRFARLSDIIIQKIFRTIDNFELELPGTVRDRINRAAKKGLVNDEDILIDIRNLRNEIAHEYLSDEMTDIFKDVLKYSSYILEIVENINIYCKKFEISKL